MRDSKHGPSQPVSDVQSHLVGVVLQILPMAPYNVGSLRAALVPACTEPTSCRSCLCVINCRHSVLTYRDQSCAGELELGLSRASLALGMRCASPQLRHRWQGLTTSLLHRLHNSSAAAAGRMRVRAAGGVFGKNMRKGFPSDEPEADRAGMVRP